jgi:hypothetical protein
MGKEKRFRMSRPYLDVTVTKFVAVDEEGKELSAVCGFTMSDGDNHYFVADSSNFTTPADVFAALRTPDALDLIKKVDDYDLGFADTAAQNSGFAINRLTGNEDGEWIEVTQKPGCFGECYPDDSCDHECDHVEGCYKACEDRY